MAILIDAGNESLQRTASLPANQAFSACGWAYVNSTGSSYRNIFLLTDGSAEIALAVDGNNDLYLQGSGGGAFASTPADDTWFFWAIKGDGSNIIGYWSALGTLGWDSSRSENNFGVLTLTKMYLGNDPFNQDLDGRLAYVKIWDTDLSSDELLLEKWSIKLQLANNVHIWSPIFPGSGERARDYSGNGRNWTENGGPTDEDPPPVSWGAPSIFIPWAVAGGENYQSVTGILTPVGIISKETNKAFAGSLTLIGNLVKQAQKAFTGSTTSTGSLVRQTQKVLTGGVTGSGILSKAIAKIFTGSITLVGSLVKQTAKSFTGSVISSGILSTTKVTLLAIGGSVTAAGTLVKQTSKILVGSLTPVGILIKQSAKVFIGSVTTVGSLATQKITGGYFQVVGGAVTMAGILVKQTNKQTAGILTASGILIRQISKTLVGSITAVGSLFKQTAKSFVGSITTVGSLATQLTFIQIVSGAVTMAGSLVRMTGKQTAGILTMTGSIAKRISKTFTGVLTAAGALARQLLGLPTPYDQTFAIEAENRVYAIT